MNKDSINKLYNELGSFKKLGEHLGISKTSARQKYLILNEKCTRCKKETDRIGKHFCSSCLVKKDIPNEKKCVDCGEIIYKKENQTVSSWCKKLCCVKCLKKRSKVSNRKAYLNQVKKGTKKPSCPEYQKRYKQTERAKLKRQISNAKRRALKRATTAESDINEFIESLLKSNTSCRYCKSTKHKSIDHVIPLSRGGSHTKDNIAIVCRTCNSKKGQKTHKEYEDYLIFKGDL